MTNETVAALQGRARTYGLLARLLACEADIELLAALPAELLPSQTGDARLDEAAALVNGYLAEHAEDLPGARTELAVDFARLFVVRGKATAGAAYPFESVYASSDGLTVSDARSQVRALYRAEGLVTQDSWNIGEDHVALELQFVQVLGERAAKALEEDNAGLTNRLLAQQLAFLDGHLLKWVPSFCDAMGRNARSAFYRGLARFLHAYLEEDRAALADHLA